MPSKRLTLSLSGLLALAAWLAPQPLLAADIMTLFTTPQERQIINSNRYKTDEPKPVEPEPEVEIELPMQMVTMEEVVASYDVSGVTLSNDGAHTVWINKIAYEDGAQLDDNSRVKVFADDGIRVRITTPDGKHHFAASGETLEVTYLAPIQN